MGRTNRVSYVHGSDALVDHGPWAGVAGLVRELIGGPVSGVVALAAYDDRQQRSVGFSLRTALRVHPGESFGYLGKLFFEDCVELSLRRTSITHARVSIEKSAPRTRRLGTHILVQGGSC